MAPILEHPLSSNDLLTQRLNAMGIKSWAALLKFIKELPYGRNSSRTDSLLVLSEGKGTCSTKHALLKKVALANSLSDVKLVIGIYKMDKLNTPGIGDLISKSSLEYIPECHCYLKIKEARVDCTGEAFDINDHLKDLLTEYEIDPSQTGEFKIQYHKEFIESHIQEMNWSLSLEEIWNIREACILRLSSLTK